VSESRIKGLPSSTYGLEQQCVEDSERWFGDMASAKSIPHNVLSLCGEVGEVANIIKKLERGSLSLGDAKTRYALSMELADVYTYLLNICGLLHIDIERAYEIKRAENMQRFNAERIARALAKPINHRDI
jgi:NTP pyrophosphatase (non-canonical NTP hydrolase)